MTIIQHIASAPYRPADTNQTKRFWELSADYRRHKDAVFAETPGRKKSPEIPITVLEAWSESGVDVFRAANALDMPVQILRQALRRVGLSPELPAGRKKAPSAEHIRVRTLIRETFEAYYEDYLVWPTHKEVSEITGFSGATVGRHSPSADERLLHETKVATEKAAFAAAVDFDEPSTASIVASVLAPEHPVEHAASFLQNWVNGLSEPYEAPAETVLPYRVIPDGVYPGMSVDDIAIHLYGDELVPGTYRDHFGDVNCDGFDGEGVDARPMVQKWRYEVSHINAVLDVVRVAGMPA
jgi:hypothetical protein